MIQKITSVSWLGFYTRDTKSSEHSCELLFEIQFEQALLFEQYIFLPHFLILGDRARISRKIDFLSDSENMDVILCGPNANPIEQELPITINGSTCRNDTQAFH